MLPETERCRCSSGLRFFTTTRLVVVVAAQVAHPIYPLEPRLEPGAAAVEHPCSIPVEPVGEARIVPPERARWLLPAVLTAAAVVPVGLLSWSMAQ